MIWKCPKKPFKRLFSKEDWAVQCTRYGFRPYERTFIDELLTFYQLNKPQQSEIPPLPPAKTKTALRGLREHAPHAKCAAFK
jgi:hypothetical protein